VLAGDGGYQEALEDCLKAWQAGGAAAGQVCAGTLVEGLEEGCRTRHRCCWRPGEAAGGVGELEVIN
jgi:hypothetical protein